MGIDATELKILVNNFVWMHAGGHTRLHEAEVAALKIFEVMSELQPASFSDAEDE